MDAKQFEINLKKLEKYHRLREDMIKFRIQASNQIKAIQRRLKNTGFEDQVEFLLPEVVQSQKLCDEATKRHEKTMVQIVKDMPCHDWYISIAGCSSAGYAMILAELGDPRNYENPAKVWKRMGLAVGIDGEAHKNKFEGQEDGYSKRRRMIMYRIEDALVKNGKEYRQIYLDRKSYELERDSQGYNRDYIEKRKSWMLQKYITSKEKIKNGRLPQFIIALRAQRIMSKELLKNLWVKWQNIELEQQKDAA